MKRGNRLPRRRLWTVRSGSVTTPRRSSEWISRGSCGRRLCLRRRIRWGGRWKRCCCWEKVLRRPFRRSARLRQNSRPRSIVPLLRPEVRMFDLDVDIGPVIESLRRGDGLRRPSPRRVTLATRAGRPRATHIMELTPLCAAFLKLCDGRTLERKWRRIWSTMPGGKVWAGSRWPAVTFEELSRRQRFLTTAPAQSAASRLPSRRSADKASRRGHGARSVESAAVVR